MTLAQQVDKLACNRLQLLTLVSEMLATVQINFERGYLVTVHDEGKLNLEKMIARWSKHLKELDQEIA